MRLLIKECDESGKLRRKRFREVAIHLRSARRRRSVRFAHGWERKVFAGERLELELEGEGGLGGIYTLLNVDNGINVWRFGRKWAAGQGFGISPLRYERLGLTGIEVGRIGGIRKKQSEVSSLNISRQQM